MKALQSKVQPLASEMEIPKRKKQLAAAVDAIMSTCVGQSNQE
jgi:hypothetical protein